MAEKFDYTKSWLNEEDFPLLGFSRNWENPSDYPTIETDEAQVRRDMQSLHDEVKDYLNETLIPRVIAEDATVAAWQAQEDAHAEAEAGRVLAEDGRVLAEQNRETAEAEREQIIAKVENLTVSSEALEYGEPASAEVTTNPETGGLNVHFGLPMGKDGLSFLPVIEGDDVPPGVTAWVDPSVESYQGGGGGGDGKPEVYVGPDEPTNGELIWVKTDAEEGSFLTKEETEALVNTKVSKELLWENASPTSTFNSQTVSVPQITNYQEYAIRYAYGISGANPDYQYFSRAPVGKTTIMNIVSSTVLYFGCRVVENKGTDFIFGKATYDVGNGLGEMNEYIIPVAIYGIKGVQ